MKSTQFNKHIGRDREGFNDVAKDATKVHKLFPLHPGLYTKDTL